MARAENDKKRASLRSRLRRVFGLESDDQRDLRQLQTKLDENLSAREALLDRRRGLVEEMERLRARYTLKKAEHDQAVGPTRKVLAREARQILLELQGLQKRDDILEAALRRHNVLIRKIEETISLIGTEAAVSAEDLEDIDVLHEERLEEAEMADEVLRDVAEREFELADSGASLEELAASLGLAETRPAKAKEVREKAEPQALQEPSPPRKQAAEPQRAEEDLEEDQG